MPYLEPVSAEPGDTIGRAEWNQYAVENVKALKALVDGILPVGIMIPIMTSVPAGWLLCYGQAVSRTTYAALFAALGLNYGAGDGSTTFNLPDMRGRSPVGLDNMGGVAASRLPGANTLQSTTAGGAYQHTLAISEIPAHTHTYTAVVNSGGTNVAQSGSGVVGPGSGTTSSVGSGGAHNNMPPYLGALYIIKY